MPSAKQIAAVAGRDVEEAARCFALGAWTASAFHILRACELVLIDYCRAGAKEVNEDAGDWAGYILGTVKDLPPNGD